MTRQTECTEVVEVALTSAFCHRQDMVGIPQRPAGPDGSEAIYPQAGIASRTSRPSQCVVYPYRIGSTQSAYSAITSKDLVSEVARIRAKPPLMHAVLRAERAAAARKDLQLAPAAEWTAVWAHRGLALRISGSGFFQDTGWAGAGHARMSIRVSDSHKVDFADSCWPCLCSAQYQSDTGQRTCCQRTHRNRNEQLSRTDQCHKEAAMQAVHEGQCGLCTHFGEHAPKSDVLVTILSSKNADEGFLDECGHPKHAALHLKVTPISGCDGFQPAAAA